MKLKWRTIRSVTEGSGPAPARGLQKDGTVPCQRALARPQLILLICSDMFQFRQRLTAPGVNDLIRGTRDRRTSRLALGSDISTDRIRN
jgi:hypothetical protein